MSSPAALTIRHAVLGCVRVLDASRSIAIAPDLLETDEFGQTHELNDGAIPVGKEDAAIDLLEYLYENVQAYKEERRSDLIEYLLATEVGGRQLAEYEIQGILFLLLVAGIDTTWSPIRSSLLHLATHPDNRKRLVEDIDCMRCQMKASEQVLMPFPAGNRDSSALRDADKVPIGREVNRHNAFGVGPQNSDAHRTLIGNIDNVERHAVNRPPIPAVIAVRRVGNTSSVGRPRQERDLRRTRNERRN